MDTFLYSPTKSVRESCQQWMDGVRTSTKSSVSIDKKALDNFAVEITNSILANKSLQVSEWDADGWHYTGKNYREGSTDEFDVLMRMERIALYVLAMDAINFCFWPTTKKNVENALEYEHLAIALRKVAELDDRNDSDEQINTVNKIIQASSTYALSPKNLLTLTTAQFKDMILIHLPPSDDTSYFEIPDVGVRCNLLNELGQGLLDKHDGSAMQMIAKAKNCADTLVAILLESFPGFRDFVNTNSTSDESSWEVSRSSPTTIYFYKRAQIAVADIWAALGRNRVFSSSTNSSSLLKCCQFLDMQSITTFPDYRVPQILRHVNVMKYDYDLATKVDNKEELPKGSHDEISIRAATVVAVDYLVSTVKERIDRIAANSVGEEPINDLHRLSCDVSAVTLDWYLWQQGEKLDRQNLLEPHHRVRTTFY